MLKETTKKAPVATCFVEGESEDYDSEDDINFDTPMINFDIAGVKEPTNDFHKFVLN